MIGIGILGAGRIGWVHAQSLTSLLGARLIAVADAIPKAARDLAHAYGAEARSIEGILSADDIGAVVIASPTTTHYDLIKMAATTGNAIFCEKPLDLSAERISDCLAHVSKAGVPLMTGFNRRFDANFASIKARIELGDIGNVELITILSRDPSPPPIDYIQTSGGLFRDMMIHDFDMARFLLGEDPIEVFAMGSCLVEADIGMAGDIDTAVVTLRTSSGKMCQISNSRRATYGYDQRVEVHGEKGMLRAENMLETQVEHASENGFTRSPTQAFFLERYTAAYAAEMRHFVEALQSNTPPSPTGEDGLKAQRLADAAARSFETGERQLLI